MDERLTRAGHAVRRSGGQPRRAHRLPRPDRLLGRRDHLPPARLLGAHRTGRADDPVRLRLGQPAAVLVQGHPRPQGRQAAARHRRLAAEHPRRRRGPARPRRRRPGPDHRCSPTAPRSMNAPPPRRSSTCCAAGRACSASRSAAHCASWSARWRSCRASAPTGRDRRERHRPRQRRAGQAAPAAHRVGLSGLARPALPGPGWYRRRWPVSSCGRACRQWQRRRGNIPGTSQANEPRESATLKDAV